jgi:hypothetical protein
MFRQREYIALPIGWKEKYGTDKESEVPIYVKRNTRGTYFSYYDVVPCIFPNKEEADKFDKEHLKHYLIRAKFADWWMSTEPEMIEIDPDTLEEVKKEYILCAAIWYRDGTEAPRGMIAQNIDTGVVIGQWRHGNCINVRSTNPVWNAKKLAERKQETPMITKYEDTLEYYDYVDGFLTSEGRFVDRWQGMKIAYEAGQVDEKRAFRNKERIEEDAISDRELMNGEPQHRTGRMCGKYNMMYSEDLY